MASALTAAATDQIIWLDAPATHFTQSTPLGNGRFGGMVFGGVTEERIVLNDGGMWSGSRDDADRPNAAEALPEIRRLLLAGKNAEAEALVNATFTCAGPGSGRARGANLPYGSHQLLGDLRLTFQHAGDAATATNYRRELDLTTATMRMSYAIDGVTYTREAFVSAPREVMVLRFTASRAGALSFDVKLDRPERAATVTDGRDGLVMTGALPDGHGGTNVTFAAAVRVVPRGGSVSADDNTLEVRNADEVLLFVTGAAKIDSFAGRRMDNAEETARRDLVKAQGATFDELHRAHVADHQRFYRRMDLRLGGGDPALAALPTPARLRALAEGKADPELIVLYANFGRYLLISSSRPGALPANLQGIWTDAVQTPWNGDWHLNINVQMNYWPAEVCNLSELHEPLFALVSSLAEAGRKTAQAYYNARGWVAHVLANPWGFTAPGESASWGATNTGSAWLCQHLWDHYLYTGDRDFLARVYPILKGSAQFYLDMLIEEPTHGWLVTAPSNSPENAFRLPDGSTAHICLGPTIDQQLLRYLFTATREAAAILGVDETLRTELAAKQARLAPTRIGSDGRIMEWLEEYPEADPHHRHVSHLWGLFPGDEISVDATPDLAAAARRSLDARGDGGTGWAIAHKLGMWARLGDGDRALVLLRRLLQPAGEANQINTSGGGTYANLFDAHPPFQIDGNFGATAAIAEMLLQSRAAAFDGSAPAGIRLLPALPREWREGEVSGLKARGGFEVAITWRDGALAEAAIRATRSGKVTIRYGNRATTIDLAAGSVRQLDADLR